MLAIIPWSHTPLNTNKRITTALRIDVRKLISTTPCIGPVTSDVFSVSRQNTGFISSVHMIPTTLTKQLVIWKIEPRVCRCPKLREQATIRS